MPRVGRQAMMTLATCLLLAGCDGVTFQKPSARQATPPRVRSERSPVSIPRRQFDDPESPRQKRAQQPAPTRRTANNGLDAAAATRSILEMVRASVEFRPTLVVWLVDRSPSAATLVREVGREVRRSAEELFAMGNDEADPAAPPTLLVAVCAFGQHATFVLDPPSSQATELTVALESVPPDESGQEKTFAALQAALERYLPYRTQQHREVVFVIVTDEAGDDGALVDSVIEAPRRYGVPIYTIGVPAPFGRTAAIDPSIEARGDAPGEGRIIRQGPESRYVERIPLDFASGRSDLDRMDSGFGPFALERICRVTGGYYLALRPPLDDYRFISAVNTEWPSPGAHRFDRQTMQRYAPDYVSTAETEQLVAENQARQALLDAARLAPIPWIDFPRLGFVKRSEAELAQQLSQAQQTAARMEPAVGALVDVLETGEADRENLTGRRWQAGYDLAMGRAAAAKARIEGYNAMLAALKRGRAFENPSSTRWILEPADTIEASSRLQSYADKARTYLERVVEDHAGTPWAKIASRELETPIGWKWREE